MITIHKMAAGAAIAVSTATLLLMAPSASAAPHRAAAVDYCLQYGEGGTDCSFTSKSQCEATASGQIAECYRNVYGKDGETLQW